ncbi:MAG TPA: hypothetical protein DCM28_00165 [Phycisphaerales bacterium]|nr:hypothetical protein [Phycisphaerales bacterium]HCD35138.1 hypothetical protein [Phycisphaerales bacterium]|tara:strand:+ start:868 stop:1707 length:840 start_codon:yes stop_codon:yes gene_type:complete
MPLDKQTLIQLAIIVPAGLLAAGVLWQRGCLKKQSLDNRPIHLTGLIGLDLVIGLLLLIFGMGLIPVVGSFLNSDDKSPLLQASMMLIGQICMFCPIMLYVFLKIRASSHSISDFGLSLHEPTHWKTGVWAAVLGIPILFAIGSLMSVLSSLLGIPTPEIAHEMLVTISQTRDIKTMVILLVSAIIAAPLFEEIVFRGFMHQAMRDLISVKTPWINICICSVIFTGIHINVAQWQTMPALFVLGGMLGWIYEKTGSLWPCIILHACFNTLNIGIVLLIL